ncbi:uncharacterized protein [Nicotiana tomentosiformis]|uniref:uncharacterized protein n=1 Tax=Nicotiana tomentosiformis TaxID=4098 RepID=UPI00388CB885
MPYYERSWRELLKGRWEARSHSLPKTIELRPLVGGDDLSVDLSASGQLGDTAGEKKKMRAPSSPSSEKKKPRRRLARKPKESSGSRAPDSDLLYQLRDEPEEDDILVARKPISPEERVTVEHEIHEADLPQIREFEDKVRELAQKRDTYKLLSEQHEEAIKSLQAELDMTQKDHADLVEHVKIFEVSDDELDIATNDQTSQVQQKVDKIDQLRAKMNEVKAMTEEWK